MVSKKTKTKIDFGKLQEKFRNIRTEISQSKAIADSHQKILLYIYDNLLEGIRRGRFGVYDGITFFSLHYQYGILYVRIKFRLSSLVKAYKDIQDIDELLREIEDTAVKSGLSVKKAEMEMEFHMTEKETA